MNRTPLEEQETIINMFPVQVTDRANVYSADSYVIKSLLRLHKKHPDEMEIVKQDKYGLEVTVPKEWIKIKPKRKVSQERIEQMITNFRK